MAIIYSYPYDTNIQDNDAWIGTNDGVGRKTKQFTVGAVANYLNIAGKVSIGGQMSYKLTSLPPGLGEMKVIGGGNGTDFVDIEFLNISTNDLSGAQVIEFLDYLVSTGLLISHQNNPSTFGHYTVVAYSPTVDPSVYKLELGILGGNGKVFLNNYYDLSPLNLAGGTGSGVTTVDTSEGSFITLTPTTPTAGNVLITADLSATGTPDATTFLRGDNTWAVAGEVDGGGTTNYVSKWQDPTTLTDSIIYDDGVSVGIGTASPGEKLDVAGDILINGITIGRGSGNVSSNTANGFEALRFNTIGDRNTAFGYQTLRTNVDDNGLTAIGYSALYSNNGGGLNTAVGYQALYSNTVANENTAVGSSTLGLTVGGGRNTAVGSAAMITNVGGSNNLALGTDALRNATANSNTAVGSYSLRTNINGSNNVAVGKDSGTFLSNGTTAVTATTNGVFIGSGTSPAANGQNNQIVIGYQAIGIGSNSVVIGNDSITKTLLKGNVGIGTTTTNYKLEVNNTSAGNLTTALTLNNGSSTTNTAVALRLQTDPTSTVNSYSEIRSTRTNSPAAGGVAMRFLATNSTTGAASEIMRLSYVGLGLGTAGTTTITDTRRGAFADGTAAAPAYSFSDDTNNGMYRITTDTLGFSTAGSEKLRISSAGNVGIGTPNPSEKLDVNGNLIVSGNFNNLYVGGKTNSNVDGIRMLCAGDDSYIDCRGGSGLNFRLDDTTGDTQRIKFHSGGNVSIGNTNNSYKLDVTGTGNFAGNLQISTVDQQTTRLLLKNTNSTGGRTFALVGGVHNETQDGFSIYDTVAAATRFTILNNGDVGIGTTSPSQKLEVNGTIKATDYKGYLPAFQHGGFLHSASASSSYIYWIPTNSLSEVISSQYYNNWIAPYSGRVKKIIMKWTGPSAAPTATSVTFRYALYPNTSSDTFPATVVDGASTNMTVTKAFSDTDITFNAGDRVQLGFTTDGGTRLLQAFAYTVVLEYDKD